MLVFMFNVKWTFNAIGAVTSSLHLNVFIFLIKLKFLRLRKHISINQVKKLPAAQL